MLCISEDDYSDSEHVHTGKYAPPRPHIQADLYKLGREIQRILMEEPGYLLNLCKLREKYEFFYGKPLDKLGYSKLVDCAYALPEPITTRNCRPNGVALLLMHPMRESCKPFQRGQCRLTPDQCECEHECDLCGYPTHGASECVDEGAPDTKPVQSYTHCCLRSKCVGDIHNPDVYVADADDVILADLAAKANRIPVDDMLKMQEKYQAAPDFANPELECVAGQPNKRLAPPRPRFAPPLDENQLKVRAFYAHFIAWLKNRHREFQDWPRNREDFSFEWETYLSGNREMRHTVVSLIDLSPSAALVYLSTGTHELIIIRDLKELHWNPDKVTELLEITGAAPPPARRWSQSSNQWHEGSSSSNRHRNSAPRPWASNVSTPAVNEQSNTVQPAPVVEQKVVFTLSKNDVIKDPPSSSMVWRPESPERFTAKIPVPSSSRYNDENDEDVDNVDHSRAWATNWRPKGTNYCDANVDLNNSNSDSSPMQQSAVADQDNIFNEDNEEGEILAEDYIDNDNEVDDAVVESSYEIQHEYYEEVVQSNQQSLMHDAVSHMDNIANAYASDSDSSIDETPEPMYQPSSAPQSNRRLSSEQTSLKPSVEATPSTFSAEKPNLVEPPAWNEPIAQSSGVNSSFSALFGNSSPSQQSLPDEPFIAEIGGDEHEISGPDSEADDDRSGAVLEGGVNEDLPSAPEQPGNPIDAPGVAQIPVVGALSSDAPSFVPETLSSDASPFVPETATLLTDTHGLMSSAATGSVPPVPYPVDGNHPKLSPFASEFVAPPMTTAAVNPNTADNLCDKDAPTITIDNKIVVGDGIGQNYRRMNDIVRRPELGFNSDVSVPDVIDNLKRLGLASGSATSLSWNADRVEELEALTKTRTSSLHSRQVDSSHHFEPRQFEPSHQVVSDQNEEFLKNLLYQAILGTKPMSSEEIDMFIHECLRLQHAGVEAVIGGMRSLWLASRNCPSPSTSLFQSSPPPRPVISNEAYSPQPSVPVSSSKGRSCLVPASMEDFLQEARLEHWQKIFEGEEIGFELLPELTECDLIDLGMSNIMERRRFQETVRMMN